AAWQALRRQRAEADEPVPALSGDARAAFTVLQQRGALFVREVAAACDVDDEATMRALAELVAAGLVTSDGFAGLRAIVQRPSPRQTPPARAASAGRWSCLDSTARTCHAIDAAVETQAWTLLRRYGIVFRRLLTREANAAPWRDIARV